jgi:hypothetical protein
MKFLISNYSTPWITEPFYVNATLNMINETSSILDSNQSLYDAFDSFKPDVFITHAGHISKDLISYLIENKEIKLLISTTGVGKDDAEKLMKFLESNKINYVFFGQNEIASSKVKNILIPAGADIFLNRDSKKYSIEKLIFVDSEDQIKEYGGTYHITSHNTELTNKVDFIMPITMLSNLFSNYNEIVFCGSSYIGTQLSFDAIYSGTKVTFDTNKNEDLEKIDSIFKKQKLLTSVKAKHTCLNRVKSMLSQVSKNISSKLESYIEKL